MVSVFLGVDDDGGEGMNFKQLAVAVYNNIQNYLGESDPRTLIESALLRADKEAYIRGVEDAAKVVFDRYRLCQVVECEAQALMDAIRKLKERVK